MTNVERVSGASVRRRERRLRSWLKHERQTVRMVLAETFHHSSAPFETKFKEEWVERHEQHEAVRGQNTARTREATYCTTSSRVAKEPVLFQPSEEEPCGGQPAPLPEVAGRQDKVERHFVEHLAEFAPVPADSRSSCAADGWTTWRTPCGSWISRWPSR